MMNDQWWVMEYGIRNRKKKPEAVTSGFIE
jgi:hypothetical protein